MSITITGGKASDVKDPDAVLDYVFDWSAWLAGNTPPETLAQHEVLVNGCTLVGSMRADGQVTARISGGTAGTPATVTCRIATNTGQVDDRTLTLKIKET